MSEKNIENVTKLDSNFAPIFDDHHSLPDLNFIIIRHIYIIYIYIILYIYIYIYIYIFIYIYIYI